MTRIVLVALVLATSLSVVGLTGCYRRELPENQKVHVGDSDSSASSEGGDTVPLDGATTLEATVRMGVGELSIESGSGNALETEFESNPDSLAPKASYEVDSSGVGRLSVDQSEWHGGLFRNMKNTWSLRFANSVPLDLSLELGAGKSDLKLGGLDLRRLTMNMGVGDGTLDFSGAWDHNVDVQLQAGIGKVTMRFPADVGVRVETHNSGIGDFVADEGFVRQGSAFVNRAYGETTATIDVSIQRGIGEVRLETVQ